MKSNNGPMDQTAREFEMRLLRLSEFPDHEERNRRAQQLLTDIEERTGAPLIVDDRVYFLHFGQAEKVAIAGDWTFWQVASPFHRVEGTDLWYTALEFSRTARLQYKLVVDNEWLLDPRNPATIAEGFGVNSEFRMPRYEDNSWLTPHNDYVERGSVEREEIGSELLGEHRELLFYTPVGATGGTELPLLIVHDGGEALHLGQFHLILDHLIAAEAIEPCCALFIPPRARNSEYAFNDRYTRFCMEEAIPFALERWERGGFTISTDPHDRCVVGASLGGLLATQMVLSGPDRVGAVIAQSPAYWVTRGAIFQPSSLSGARNVLAVLQTGTICDARELTRIMYGRLKGIGTEVRYFEYDQGHTWGNWRSNFAEAIFAWNELRMPAFHGHRTFHGRPGSSAMSSVS